jgi:hypothetical protein
VQADAELEMNVQNVFGEGDSYNALRPHSLSASSRALLSSFVYTALRKCSQSELAHTSRLENHSITHRGHMCVQMQHVASCSLCHVCLAHFDAPTSLQVGALPNSVCYQGWPFDLDLSEEET